MATMKRTFHPVGHGAFYTERFYDGEENIANIVFDCGCFETAKTGTSTAFFQQQIDNTVTNIFNANDKIDALFVSHFHQDHINGIKKLIEHCNVKRVFIPQLTPQIILDAYLGNATHYESIDTIDDFLRRYQDEVKIIQVGEFNHNEDMRFETYDIDSIHSDINTPTIITTTENHWQYIPFNSSNKDGDIVDAIRKDVRFSTIWVGGSINLEQLSRVVKDIGIEECKRIYQSVCGENHNSYSMTLYSGKNCIICHLRVLKLLDKFNPKICHKNCLYMGDYEAADENYFTQLKNFYKNYWNHIGLIQVPHHGSENNLNKGLYSPAKICIISAGETDRYDHPDKITLDTIIENNSIPIIVTENQNTKQQFTYNI